MDKSSDPKKRHEGLVPNEDTGRPSRRLFLKKTSAAAVVSTLSTQPVWGACTVSGGMSGGSRPNEVVDPCEIPSRNDFSGRSPGFWSEAIDGGSNGNGNAVVSAFNNYGGNDKEKLRCYIKKVAAENQFTFTIEKSTGTKTTYETTVKDALKSQGNHGVDKGSLAFNLAGIWLNVYFDFNFPAATPGRDVKSSPKEQVWVDHFAALVNVAALNGDDNLESIFDNVWDEGTTNWSIGSLPECDA